MDKKIEQIQSVSKQVQTSANSQCEDWIEDTLNSIQTNQDVSKNVHSYLDKYEPWEIFAYSPYDNDY